MPQDRSMPTVPSPKVPHGMHQLATELADVKLMRRGSLSQRTIKNGKPGCACAHDPTARHSPYFSLTRAVGGKTHSRFPTREQAVAAKRQIEAGRAFRDRTGAYWDACEQWADKELTAPGAGGLRKAGATGRRTPAFLLCQVTPLRGPDRRSRRPARSALRPAVP